MPVPHPPEFRRRAVELAREKAAPIAQIAKDLGISESCLTSRYGTAAATAWDRVHARLTHRAAWLDHHGDLPVIEGTLIRLQVDRPPGDRDPKPVWLWWSCTGAPPAGVDRCWQAFLRRFDLEHLPDVQASPRLDRTQDPRPTGCRPLDRAHHHRPCPAPARPGRSLTTCACPGNGPLHQDG